MERAEYKERLDEVRATIQEVNDSIESLNERHSGFLGQLHPERLTVGARCFRDLGGAAIELVKLAPYVVSVAQNDREKRTDQY